MPALLTELRQWNMMMKIKVKIGQNVLNILIWAVFLFFYIPGVTGNVYWSVSRQFLTMIFMTLGLMVEMICGVLDLAFMAEISAATCIGAYLLSGGMPALGALGIMLLFHFAVGGVKGWMVAKLQVNPIIITLALQIILSNVAGIFTGDMMIRFRQTDIYRDHKFWVLISCLLAAVFLFLVFVLNKTYYGKYIRMMGENMDAVRNSGLPYVAIQVILSMASSAIFWIASVILLFITSAGSSSNGGHYLYPAIAAACMGGINFLNGRGNVSGVFIGTVSIVMLMHMMVHWGIQSVYETILIGFLIIFSILLNHLFENN